MAEILALPELSAAPMMSNATQKRILQEETKRTLAMRKKVRELGIAKGSHRRLAIEGVIASYPFRVTGLVEALWKSQGEPLYVGAYEEMLRYCIMERSLEDIELILEHMRNNGAENEEHGVFFGNTLVYAFGKCFSTSLARSAFDRISEPNALSWSALVDAYMQNEAFSEAVELFTEMKERRATMNPFTACALISACCKLGKVAEARLVYESAREVGIQKDGSICAALVQLYGKNGCLEEAEQIFQSLEGVQGTALFTSMIEAYVETGRPELALETFWTMMSKKEARCKPDAETFVTVLGACASPEFLLEGKNIHRAIAQSIYSSNITVRNALLIMYSKCQEMEEAERIYSAMEVKETSTFNCMITGYSISKWRSGKAFDFYRKMRLWKISPDAHTLSTLLELSVRHNMLLFGRNLHMTATKFGLEKEERVQMALINFYAKFHCIVEAVTMFHQIQDKGLGAYNSILEAYADSDHERAKDGLVTFRSLLIDGLRPDSYTYSSVLDCCGSLGALKVGQEVHELIKSQGWETNPIVQAALVEMYSKCGRYKDAKSVFELINNKDFACWNAMLAATSEQGEAAEAVELSYLMNLDGAKQDEATAVSFLRACSRGRFLEEGIDYFKRLQADYGILNCEEISLGFVGLLGRAGLLKEANEVVSMSLWEPGFDAWMSLLSACKLHGEVKIGKVAAKKAMTLRPQDPSSYTLMGNLYSVVGRPGDFGALRKTVQQQYVKTDTTRSWIEHRNKRYEFTVDDSSSPRHSEIRAELDRLHEQIVVEEGYFPLEKDVVHGDESLKFHGEKMTIAFGLISTEPGTELRIINSHRMCGDCHVVARMISKVTNREIFIRDGKRSHLFRNGGCSCGDHW